MPVLSLLGDWGTSQLRLYLVETAPSGPPRIAGHTTGPGVKFTTDFESAFLQCVRQLPAHPGGIPVFLAGMIGSNIGWRDAGYVPCPARAGDHLARAVSFDAAGYPVTILPGACYVNDHGYRDILRGEDVQLFGAQDGQAGRQVYCLPGTHNKWAVTEDNALHSFTTTLPGELYETLSRHSVLVPTSAAPCATTDTDAFDAGVSLVADNPKLGLLAALFAVRCHQVSGELSPAQAASFLSGVLTGSDVRDNGLPVLHDAGTGNAVKVIAEPALAQLYLRALVRFGISGTSLDATQCTVNGLDRCARQSIHRGDPHET